MVTNYSLVRMEMSWCVRVLVCSTLCGLCVFTPVFGTRGLCGNRSVTVGFQAEVPAFLSPMFAQNIEKKIICWFSLGSVYIFRRQLPESHICKESEYL